MANNETTAKPRRKLKISHILIFLLIIIIAVFGIFRIRLRLKLNAKISAISAAGYPVTCAELDEWYSIPESVDNAAEVIIESFSHYSKWDEEELKLVPVVGKAELPLRTEPMAEETKTLVALYLADNQEALDLLHKGAEIEHSRYPIDLSKGFEAVMPDLSNIRTAARLLQLEGVLHADNAKPELAARSITSIFGLARSLDKEPILISQLVRMACQALGVSALEYTVNKTEFTDEQLVNFKRMLANAQDSSAMTRAFAGERCAGASIFKEHSARILKLINGGQSKLTVIPLALYKFIGLADMDASIYLDLMSDYIETTQLPPHQRQEAVDAIEAKFTAISKVHILLHAMMPALSRVTTIDIRNIAQLHTAQVALAIQRYRLATGNIPESLTDLLPTYLDAVPKDPFDGKELRYKKLETGFVVYSIGEDGNDDGGKEKPRKKTSGSVPVDITFIIQR